jgi:hypothetical protein
MGMKKIKNEIERYADKAYHEGYKWGFKDGSETEASRRLILDRKDRVVTMDEEFEKPEPLLGSMQEGEEWIARLEADKIKLLADIQMGNVSDVGMGMLHYGLEKTEEAIEQIKLEIILLMGDEGES